MDTEDKVLQSLEKKIRAIVNSFTKGKQISLDDREDFRQELRISALKAIRKYNPNKGASIETYVGVVCENDMKDLMKKSNHPIFQMIPLDDLEDYDEPVDDLDLEKTVLDTISLQNMKDKIYASCKDETDISIVQLVMQGATNTLIGQMLGINKNTVGKRIKRLKHNVEAGRRFE